MVSQRSMKQDESSFCNSHVCECDPFRSFGRRCGRLVKELRARFYILRRCVAMLWRDCGDP